ncbi:MAG: hypothetical protein ACREBG_00510 [Pyrinomonadaceae bacterium]
MQTKLAPSNPPAAFKDWLFEPGCYVDSARGAYAIDRIADLAEGFGFVLGEEEGNLESLSGYEFAGKVEDEIDDYLNSQFAIPDHVWGRNDNGDWGLWAVEEKEHGISSRLD